MTSPVSVRSCEAGRIVVQTRRAMRRFAPLLLAAATLANTCVHAGDAVEFNAWLSRIHDASLHRAYTGTFVVSALGAPGMASAHIWHVCDGSAQMERVDALTGPSRTTYRRNEQVLTLYPQSHAAIAETRDSLGLFPNLLKSDLADIASFYALEHQGQQRIAGFDAEVVQLVPKDSWRYGYRIWNEKSSGLVMQVQTLDVNGQVLEQAAFSELKLDAPVSVAQLSAQMADTRGYRIERRTLQKVDAQGLHWTVDKPPGGFHLMACYARPAHTPFAPPVQEGGPMQWMFSDGLANVSLFVEDFNPQRHQHEGLTDMGGATHIFTRRSQDWWITAVGEVPNATLSAFAQALARK